MSAFWEVAVTYLQTLIYDHESRVENLDNRAAVKQ